MNVTASYQSVIMRLWNWIIGKNKKRCSASWFIASGALLVSSVVLLVIEHIGVIRKNFVECVIAIVIYWAVWRFVVFLFNMRK